MSDSLLIAEITDLRAKLAASEADNADLRLRIEAMGIAGAREIPSAAALIGRAEIAESKREALEAERDSWKDNCLAEAKWRGELAGERDIERRKREEAERALREAHLDLLHVINGELGASEALDGIAIRENEVLHPEKKSQDGKGGQ